MKDGSKNTNVGAAGAVHAARESILHVFQIPHATGALRVEGRRALSAFVDPPGASMNRSNFASCTRPVHAQSVDESALA